MFLVVQLVVLFSIHLFHQINTVDAFTAPCNVSVLTMMNVTKCPSTLSSYKEAAMKKNCLSWASETQDCRSFEYHCVLSDDFKYAIEVCAPSILIIDKVCAMFNTQRQSIMRIHNKICEACPYSYKSTYAFIYSECYANITDVVTTTPMQRNNSDENDHSDALKALGTTFGIMFIVILIFIYFLWRKKVQDKRPPRIINGGPRIIAEEEVEILPNNGNTHARRSEGISFIRFSDDLAKQFPHTKLAHLKYILRASGRVKNIESLDAANSVVAVFSILQSENIFRKKDVIFLQFLFRLTDCQDLNNKCIKYALSMKALCFFEATSEQGNVNVKFHIKGNLDDYTRQDIDDIVEEVADMLECEKRNILVNGVLHSSSFLLVLSIKETYVWKLSCMNEQDKMKLQRLNIDYLMIGEEVIVLDGSKGSGKEKVKNELDAGIEFAKLCNYIARQFPQEKLQNLKDVIRGYCKLSDSTVLKNANSALECFSIVLEMKHFTPTNVRCLQILCKKTNCQELFMKCLEFAKEHGSLCYSEHNQDSGFAELSFQAPRWPTSYEDNEFRKIQYTIADILNCSPDDILISHPDIGDGEIYMIDDSASLHPSDSIPEELHCFTRKTKVGRLIDYRNTESDEPSTSQKLESIPSFCYYLMMTPIQETDVISHLKVEETFSPDEPSTFQDCDSIPSAEQTEVSPNDQPISSTCTKESETVFTSPLKRERTFGPDEPSTFNECAQERVHIINEEETGVFPNDQPISSTCTKDAVSGGKSKDVEIDEEGDASKHSETAFKAMEYGKPTFMVNKKCSFIVSVKKKYEYRLHDMTEHDLEKLNSCNIRFIQIE